MLEDWVLDIRLAQCTGLFSAGLAVPWEYAGFQNALTYFPLRIPWPSRSREEEEARAYFEWELGMLSFQTCYSFFLTAVQKLVLPATSSSEGCTASEEEWLEILLKYGCLITREENSFTKIPIVRTDRWFSPPVLSLPRIALPLRRAYSLRDPVVSASLVLKQDKSSLSLPFTETWGHLGRLSCTFERN